MAKLIEVKNIDETPTIIPTIKDETVHSKKDLNSLEVARIPWRTYLEMQNYNKDKYKMCEICISDQKKKFGGRTPIECTGLRDYKPILEEKYDADIIETIIEELSEDELLELKAIFSPVDWFRANVHDPETYTERWYQSLTLSCSARNKVLRLGRRCIEENEQVLMANGSYKKIKNINIGDFVISNRDNKVVTNKVTDVINNGKRNLYRIKTNDGKEVTLTEDHQVLTDNGWKSIEEGLKKGDLVSHLPKIESIETNNIDTEEAKLLGYLLTDGYLSDKSNQTVKATFNNYKYIEEISSITESKFGFKGTIKKRSESDAYDIWLTDGNHGTKSSVKTWLKSLDLLKEKYKLRDSSELITSMSKESLILFLNRAYAGDGCVSTSYNPSRPNGLRGDISFDTGDVIFAKTLSNSLHKLGIPNNITYCKERISSDIKSNNSWRIRVSSSYGIRRFFNTIGFIYGKEEQSKRLLEAVNSRSREVRYSDSDQFEFIKIKSITNLEVEGTVYDITVENDHNFVTNGLVVHNCGKTFSIVMDLIYRIATASRPINILVAAPLVTMIHEIEKAFKALSRVLEQENFITKSRATPTLEMTFFNGSILQGITTNDGGKASRGKKADIIWLDETDYMDRKAIEAIEAIKLDNPNVEMFITSTPKGEGNLYEFAQQENVKEFHYPSYVIPHYNDAIDQDLRGKLSEIGFTQEVIALYGLDQDSVFQQHFIEDSYELYIPEFYNESFVLNNRDRFIVIIGVDWNHDNNGTRIIVVGYDKIADRFFCVEKKKIAKVNLTQELSVNMVVELNRKYNADHIICDEGFGIGQVSELRVRGKEQYGKVPANHPDIKLTKTESVQFGATLEIRDPTTYETLKKRTKQYIVELAQKLLEAKRLALDPANDSELIMQLKNYSIIKTGMRGNVYKAKDKKIGDHDLDGYMLALYMFDKVYGDYITPKAYEHISMMPNSNTEFYDPSRTVQKDVALFSSSNLSGKRKRFKSRRKW